MKKLLVLAFTAIAFLLLPSSKLFAQATVISDRYEEDYTTEAITCDGTAITLTSHDRNNFHAVINNNRVNLSIHGDGHATGIDAAGNEYNAHYTFSNSVKIPLENGAFVFSLQHKVYFISKGSAPNFSLSYTERVTVNANGDVTVERFNFSTSCD